MASAPWLCNQLPVYRAQSPVLGSEGRSKHLPGGVSPARPGASCRTRPAPGAQGCSAKPAPEGCVRSFLSSKSTRGPSSASVEALLRWSFNFLAHHPTVARQWWPPGRQAF